MKFHLLYSKIWLICLPATTSACIFKDTLRKHSQVFLKFRDSIIEICLHLINFNCTPDFLLSLMQSSGAWTSNEIPLQESALAIPAILITLPFSFFDISYPFHQIIILISKMTSNFSMASDESNVFYVEQGSSEFSPQRHNTPNILNSTEISEQHTARVLWISSIASAEPRIFTIDDNSNEPTMPYGFGRQLPIVPPSLNDLNLPPNPFNILNAMAIVTRTRDNNEQYSPESPEPSLPSPIPTPPMNVSAYNSWETTHTTTDDNTLLGRRATTGLLDISRGRNVWIRRWTPEDLRPITESITAAITSAKAEKIVEPGNVLSKRSGSVAARLQSLRTDDPLNKGHPRSIEKGVELWNIQTYSNTYCIIHLSIYI